ncbi:hypothetical protein BBJ28_00010764 [Nothophytophthora sp. Chile5]|nr:hypothetical protein BBJ28_00010764 [Nothophytophthora sp. Chile5]
MPGISVVPLKLEVQGESEPNPSSLPPLNNSIRHHVTTEIARNLIAVTECVHLLPTLVDQFPRGTALRAARTKEQVRVASVPGQNVSKHGDQLMLPASESTKLGHSESVASISSLLSGDDSGDEGAPLTLEADLEVAGDSVEGLASNNQPPTQSDGHDLARRAARRVTVWKRSKQDQREEEERSRQAKLEQEQRRKNHAATLKQRRRSEIYALNALLRQLQQEKVAQYIAAQKQLQDERQQQECRTGTPTEEHAPVAQVQSIGV